MIIYKPVSNKLRAVQHGYNPVGTPLPHYINMINHLVKKGYIVIFDEFQPSPITHPRIYESNAATIIKDGINYIANNPSQCVQIAEDANGALQFGMIGYSVGGVTSLNLAANYKNDSIPKPKFLFTMEANPGPSITPRRDASKIAPDTYVVMTDAQEDDINTYTASSTFWNQMSQIPAAQKQWIGLFSDYHPNDKKYNLVADHRSPISNAPNALDFYGFYKWTTALADYVFYGTHYNYWWGNTAQETYMGTWGDGVPVIPAVGSQQAFMPGH